MTSDLALLSSVSWSYMMVFAPHVCQPPVYLESGLVKVVSFAFCFVLVFIVFNCF